MIRELETDGHSVVITCRPLANTIDLLDLHGFKYEVVGEHYGAKLRKKVFGYPVRVWQLRKYLAPMRIDVAVSQSSFHSPLVARLLGIRSIYMNDNEHALGNVPSFICASKIMVPEFLTLANLKRQLANPKKVVRYPGVKEGIYLWGLQEHLNKRVMPNKHAAKPSVYVRPEPWTAQYYRGRKDFLDDVLVGIKEQVNLTLLPRGKVQGEHYRESKFSGMRIVDTAMDIADIAPGCDLFVGAGGTMTREMSVLGVPTISVYQDKLLDVDQYLLSQAAFSHMPKLTAADLLYFLGNATRKPADRMLLAKGRQAYAQIKQAILTSP